MERLKIIGKVLSEKNGLFSAKQISEETGVPFKESEMVLDRLCREGLLEKYRFESLLAPVGRGRPKARIIYQVANKQQLQSRLAPRQKEDTAQDRMWMVIRYLRTFSRSDLIRLAEAKFETAKFFTKMLRRAGYIKPSREHGRGIEWSLVKDPGPRRPYVGDQAKKQC